MSTAIMAPERQPAPANNPKSEQAKAQTFPKQLICLLVLVLSDLAAIALSLELAIFMRSYLMRHVGVPKHPLTFPFAHYLAFAWLWLVPIVFLGVEGLYTRRRSLWNEVGQLTKAVGLSLVALLATLALTELTPLVSRITILLTATNLLILLPVVRYWTKRVLMAAGPWKKRILILGTTDMAMLAMRALTSDPFLGYEVAGLLDDDPTKLGCSIGFCNGAPIHVLGSLSETQEQMRQTRSRDVLIAMPDLPEEKLLALVHELQPYCDSIYVVPQLWGLPMMNLQIDGFLRERVMMLKLSNNLAKPWNGWLKRGLDLLLGTAITLLAFPICMVIAILVKLDSKGPALFIQERLGHRGANFRCLKFRTMRVNADEILQEYLERNPLAVDEWQKFAKLIRYDPRLTRLGGFLRRWSLDELPQLLNVLRGEMSLVGPRPYIHQERGRIGVDLHTILSARPGMTGLWQVSGRNKLTFEDRVQLEAWYVRNWTVWLDCIVLAKTFRTVLFPESGESSEASPRITSAAPKYLTAKAGHSVLHAESLHQTDAD